MHHKYGFGSEMELVTRVYRTIRGHDSKIANQNALHYASDQTTELMTQKGIFVLRQDRAEDDGNDSSSSEAGEIERDYRKSTRAA